MRGREEGEDGREGGRDREAERDRDRGRDEMATQWCLSLRYGACVLDMRPSLYLRIYDSDY